MKHQSFKKSLKETVQEYKPRSRKTVELFRKCQGVLLVYILLFYVLRRYILVPLGTRFWSYVLSTTSSSFISNTNAADILRYPQLIIAGLIMIILYYLLSAWEVSGVLMCIEYHYQNRPVRLVPLLYLSALNLKNLRFKENYMFFVYLLVIMPVVQLYDAAGMISGYSIPEYIAQWIEASLFKSLLLAVIILIMYFFSLRWFYVLQEVLLKHLSFREACSESREMMEHRKLFKGFELAYFSFVRVIHICLIPFLLSVVVLGILIFFTIDLPSAVVATRFICIDLFLKMFKAVTGVYLEMAVMCFLMVSWHESLKEHHLEDEVHLPESGIKTKGKIYTFRRLYLIVYTGVTVITVLFYLGAIAVFDAVPELVEVMAGTTEVFAHKGYSSVAPENTMDAFEAAVESESCEWIELDVRETKDGVPVVIHNADLKDAAGVKVSVYDLTYEELRTYNACYSFKDGSFSDTYIPTLEEVLDEYSDQIRFLIEIKADKRAPDLPDKIVDLVHSHNMSETCKIHSSDYASLQRVKELDPSLSCGLIIAIGSGTYYDLPDCDFFSVEHTFITSRMVDRIHNAGKKIYAWTVNESESLNSAIAKGADGIITDDPETAWNTIHSADHLITQFLESISSDYTPVSGESIDYENGNY